MSTSSTNNYYIALWNGNYRVAYSTGMYLCVDNAFIIRAKTDQKTVIKIDEKLAYFIAGLGCPLPTTGYPGIRICDII